MSRSPPPFCLSRCLRQRDPWHDRRHRASRKHNFSKFSHARASNGNSCLRLTTGGSISCWTTSVYKRGTPGPSAWREEDRIGTEPFSCAPVQFRGSKPPGSLRRFPGFARRVPRSADGASLGFPPAPVSPGSPLLWCCMTLIIPPKWRHLPAVCVKSGGASYTQLRPGRPDPRKTWTAGSPLSPCCDAGVRVAR